MYFHVETRDRVEPGTVVETGGRIGHPSCEGGVSTGTHVHVVRKFNGEWILADGPLPFNLSGYVAKNGDTPYQGSLESAQTRIIANPLGTLRSYISLP